MPNAAGQKQGGKKLLGQMLVDAGIIDEIQLAVALGAQNESGLKLGKQLLKLGFVEERDLAVFLKDESDLGIPLPKRNISKEALNSVPEQLAFKYKVIPLAIVGKTLVLAIPDPKDIKTLDELTFVLGKKIQPVRAFEWEIETALLKFYKHFSDDELEMLTNVSSSAEQYKNATMAFGGDRLFGKEDFEPDSALEGLEAPQPEAKAPPSGPQKPQRQSPQPSRQPSPAPPPQRTAGAPPPVRHPQPLQAPAPASRSQAQQSPPPLSGRDSGLVFELEHTSLTADERTKQIRQAKKTISDAAINLKNADIIQVIIDLLMDKKIITEDEFIKRLRDLQKGLGG